MGVTKGFKVTFKNLFEDAVTTRYPHEKRPKLRLDEAEGLILRALKLEPRFISIESFLKSGNDDVREPHLDLVAETRSRSLGVVAGLRVAVTYAPVVPCSEE